jgi:hypothetical protein
MEVLRLTHGVTEAAAREQKVAEARRILCHHDEEDSGAVGVAIGFVQSGKTMSFTTLTALAADNGYRVVVVVLGNTHLLVGQNTERLEDDLQIRARQDWVWAHLHLPKANTDLDGLLIQEDRLILITVLKHASRLNKVAQIFENSHHIKNTSVLIIDDEADQASLNAGAHKGTTTPTYRSIRRMRAALQRHLYVQYTATPFAPLLLEPQDGLAPKFAELLAPGSGYTGGRTFFLDERDAIVRHVSDDEAEETSPNSLPTGLRTALETFLVGAAHHKAEPDLKAGVSMLIHTSGLKADHQQISRLVKAYLQGARTRIALPPGDPGARAWLDQLRPVRDDLIGTGAPPLGDDDFHKNLAWTLRMARVWVVNSSEEGENPDWALSPVNVLVGGNKLDRGFTVRGLTTTYITRRASGGQADTIEQRARCYGYKRPYLPYCRVFAPNNVVDAFTSLVHTEADMRESIAAWQADGRDLREWSVERGLLLPDDIRPTRKTVLRDTYERQFSGWSFLRRPLRSAEATAANIEILAGTGVLGAPERTYGDVSVRSVRIPVTRLVSTLLEPWHREASAGWDHGAIVRGLTSLAASQIVGDCDLLFFELAGGVPRTRAWREPDGFDNLMQGSNEGTGYPGDRRLVEGLQLQVHRVSPRDSDDVTLALAIYVPEHPGGLGQIVRRGAGR